MKTQKNLLKVYKSGSNHMVGDGFHVRNLFPSNGLTHEVSPFLMLDYAGPTYYKPSNTPRGVGEHPHRGFETVTIVYQGEVEHRDSAGNYGKIGPGDVQWMTAASGVVHEEKHSQEFTRNGGTLQMVQLWVNLPRELKMSNPRYQTLLLSDIPSVELADGAGFGRVIAGRLLGKEGPAKTFTPLSVFDLRMNAGHTAELELPKGHNTSIFVVSGNVVLNGYQTVREAELGLFSVDGETLSVTASDESTVLVLTGEPINEPIASYGPFVMNTRDELVQAVADYQNGNMGHLA